MKNIKLKIAICINKRVPLSDYRILSVKSLSNKADFHLLMPEGYNAKLNLPFRCHAIPLGEGVQFKKDLKGLFKLFSIFSKNKFDIVHFYSTKYYLIGPLIAKVCGIKKTYITISGFGRTFSSHRLVYKFLKPIFLVLLMISVSVSDLILAQNKDDEDYLKNLLPRYSHKIDVLKSSIDERVLLKGNNKKDFSPCIVNKNGRLNFVNVCRIMPDKGIIEYIALCRKIYQQYGDRFCAFLVGPPSVGHEKTLCEVKQAEKENIITYIGEVQEVCQVLRPSDIFVFTSFREGMPRVVLEAQALGLPCVAFDVQGVHDIIVEGKTGFLSPLGDINNMYERIQELLFDNELRKKMAINAKEHMRKHFSISKYCQNLSVYYKI